MPNLPQGCAKPPDVADSLWLVYVNLSRKYMVDEYFEVSVGIIQLEQNILQYISILPKLFK